MLIIEHFIIVMVIIFICIISANLLFDKRASCKRLRNVVLYKITIVILLLYWSLQRIIITKHAPFSNAYESMIFFGSLYTIKILFFKFENLKKSFILFIPSILIFVSSLFLSYNLKKPNLLIPVLKSFWIYIHVPAFFIGYVSLTFSFVIAQIGILTKLKLQAIFYKEFKTAFFFISLGIITGAFWGEQSWSSFWNWDPKEMWALLTWLLLSIIFHLKNQKLQYLFITLSFLSMLFTYFGVMFLLSGLHSYK